MSSSSNSPHVPKASICIIVVVVAMLNLASLFLVLFLPLCLTRFIVSIVNIWALEPWSAVGEKLRLYDSQFSLTNLFEISTAKKNFSEKKKKKNTNLIWKAVLMIPPTSNQTLQRYVKISIRYRLHINTRQKCSYRDIILASHKFVSNIKVLCRPPHTVQSIFSCSSVVLPPLPPPPQ